jgi:hypothetical protein
MTEERTETGGFARLLQGLAIGAAMMYLLDPDKGRRRRALLHDQLNRLGSDIGDLAHDAARDSANRLQGVRARVDRRRHGDGSVDELRLIERVRAALGRVVSHPHAIQVGAMQGTVRLSGPVLAHEFAAVLATARVVPGVTDVENRLDVHERSDIPALQGPGRQRRGQDYPAPALRMGALLGGGVLALYALRREGLTRLGIAGIAYAVAKRALYGTPNGDIGRARGPWDASAIVPLVGCRPVLGRAARLSTRRRPAADPLRQPSRHPKPHKPFVAPRNVSLP